MNRKLRKVKKALATDYSRGNGRDERRMHRYIKSTLISYKGGGNANTSQVS